MRDVNILGIFTLIRHVITVVMQKERESPPGMEVVRFYEQQCLSK